MRVVFMGSPPFAAPALEAVCSRPRTDVATLVTRPDKPRGRGLKVDESPLVRLAREHGIEVLQPTSARDPAFMERLRGIAPELIVVASFGHILGADLLALPAHGCLNVHASLLPRHRGAAPIQAAILAGDSQTGVSIQRMVAALDEGDVMLEERTPIGAHENAGELLERLSRLGAVAIVRALDAVENGTARFTPQDPARATYARKIKKEHGTIDWSKSSVEIDRHVRAFTPWPGARTTAPGGMELVLLDVLPIETWASGVPPGTIDVTRAGSAGGAIARAMTTREGTAREGESGEREHGEGASREEVSGERMPRESALGEGTPSKGAPKERAPRESLIVQCGTGALEVRRLKPAGKGAMEAVAWLRGARLAPGARLGAA